jgi:hypothetical protein
MKQLPMSVIAAREEANTNADVHDHAWEVLQSIEAPTLADLQKWIATRKVFHASQEKFEQLLRQSLTL